MAGVDIELKLARWLEAKGKHEKAREPARARAHAGA
jgi:hypothetical protein